MSRPASFCCAVPLLCLACSHAPPTISVAGTVEIREVRLSPLAPGRVARLLKDEGDTVRAGDTVAVLDQPGLQALIDQRRAQAMAAAARVRDLERGARGAELDRARADVAAAQADSERTANDLERAGRLLPRNVISPQQFDAAKSAAAAAAARVKAAREALALLAEGARSDAVRAARREFDAAQAGLAAVQAVRDELTLLAPDAGIVLTRYAERGEALTAGMPVVSVGVVGRPWVRAYVGEPFIARLKLGQQVGIRVDGYPDRPFTGRVSEISPRAEFTPRAALTERERADLVFGIKVDVDNAEGRLKAGMPVTLEVPLLP